jgi:peptide chain release factor 1
MFDKLSTVESRYDELMHRLGTGEVQSDPVEFRKAAKALSDMEPLVQKYREYKAVDQDIAGSEELVRGSDPEMRELAEEELKTLYVKRDALLEEIKILLIPKDPNDEKNVLLEIRAGTGGEEAALFAGELYRMYHRYAERQGWKLDVMSPRSRGAGFTAA